MKSVLAVTLGGVMSFFLSGYAAAQQQTPRPIQPQAPGPIADEPDPNVPILGRERPAFRPLGIRAGSFLVFPSIGVLGEYDDNAQANDGDEQDDFSVSVLPRITARSQFNRNSLDASVFGDFAFFTQEPDNNYNDFGFEADGTYEINRANVLSGNVGIQRDHDSRDDQEEADSEEVTQFWDSEAAIAYRYNFNRFFVQPRADVRRIGFEEAGDFTNEERDRTQYGGNLRLGLQLSQRFDVFTQGRVARSIRDTSDAGGVKRDNTRYIGTVGTGVDITGIIFGEAQAGFEFIEFDEDDLDSEQNPFAELGITWNVTRLTSLLFQGAVSQEDTNVSLDGEEASTRFEQEFGVEVQHELLRNVILEANGIYERDDFEGIDRTDNTFRTGVGATYLINRNLSLIANYNFSFRESDVDDSEFTRNIVRVGINAQL